MAPRVTFLCLSALLGSTTTYAANEPEGYVFTLLVIVWNLPQTLTVAL